jgi:hypothetical protein
MAMLFDHWIAPGKLAWSVLSAVWKFFRRNKRHLTPQERLALRTRWKPLFEGYLWQHQRQKLRQDIIIRDMRRMDKYPHIDEGRRISPWCRTDLIDTYEKGIMVALGRKELVTDGNGLRYTDRQGGEKGETTLMLTGFIPYENIENVDWTGDNYYGYPHVYCYFDMKATPYERLAFCKSNDSTNGREFFTEVADYEAVRKLSKKRGIRL